MGEAFGETGIKDGSMNWLVGDPVASSIPYFVGWMASGYYVVGDIRDIGETIYHGDGVGTALNAVAFAPAIGDAEKTVNTVRKVATKYPNKAQDLGIYLSKEVLDYVPNDYTKRQIWELCLSPKENEIINKLLSEGKTVDEILVWVKSEKGLVKEYFEKRVIAYNDVAGIANKFYASKKVAVIGKWIDGNPQSYEKVGDAIGANTYVTNSALPVVDREIMNQKFLDLAEENGKIKCCSNPNIEPTGTTFRKEIDYLWSKGYQAGPEYTETINGVTYHFWDMVKV